MDDMNFFLEKENYDGLYELLEGDRETTLDKLFELGTKGDIENIKEAVRNIVNYFINREEIENAQKVILRYANIKKRAYRSAADEIARDIGFIIGAILGSSDLKGGEQGIDFVNRRIQAYDLKKGAKYLSIEYEVISTNRNSQAT